MLTMHEWMLSLYWRVRSCDEFTVAFLSACDEFTVWRLHPVTTSPCDDFTVTSSLCDEFTCNLWILSARKSVIHCLVLPRLSSSSSTAPTQYWVMSRHKLFIFFTYAIEVPLGSTMKIHRYRWYRGIKKYRDLHGISTVGIWYRGGGEETPVAHPSNEVILVGRGTWASIASYLKWVVLNITV